MEKMMKKNDELILEITDMGSEGEGIGHADGYALFVKDAIAGDVIRARITKAKKNFAYARLMEIIQPSIHRVEPKCPVARQCGGCQLQHCSYEWQLHWKQEKIANCLRRIGGLDQVPMEPIVGMEEPYHYRNKAQYPVAYDKDGKLVTGFYARRTHTVIPYMDCLIQDSGNPAVLELVMAFLEEYQIPAYQEKSHTGLVRHILIRTGKASGQIMVCLVINGKKLPHAEKMVRRLLDSGLNITSICLNRNEDKTNRILGEEILSLYGPDYIEDRIGDIRYRISPLSFYQINPEQTRRLYETVSEYADLQGDEVVWDLYCGIGTISLYLSKKADRVCGVEIVPQAIRNANENARINHISNVEFYAGAAEEIVPQKYRESGGSLRADVVILDPPRKGCDEKLLKTVVQMEPERIVYVSCDPATLARDLKYLCGMGYELKRVRGCDMFGMSYHVETCVLLTHKKPTSYIEVTMDYDKIVSEYKPKHATYREITEYVKEKYNLVVKSTTIAEVKRSFGLKVGDYNNQGSTNYHKEKITPEKRQAVEDALRHFGII